MITKEDFYLNEHYPDRNTKRKIWKRINRNIKPESSLYNIYNLPGFYYGFASAIILFFTFYGLYSFGKDLIYESKPEELKLSSAYQSAIKEFESVIPAVASEDNFYRTNKDLHYVKMKQLNDIDLAISDLKSEIQNNDLNSLKQLRLRQLYVTKIKIILEIIENGEITL